MSEGYRALRHGAAWLDLSSRGRLVARGRDRARLFHNLTSNEIKKLPAGAGCYAFLLSPQGRIQADLTLLAFEDRYLLDTEPELRAKVQQHIRRYIIADQVELEDVTGTTAALGIEGPEAAAMLLSLHAPVPDQVGAHRAWGESTIAAVSVTGQPGYRVYCAAARLAELACQLEAAGVKAATAEDARLVRIENGKPRYGDDIGEASLPQETGQMHAVSFTKGCYLGQEIVERIRSQGHVNRSLLRLEIEGSEPLPRGARVTAAGGAEAGEITSSACSPARGKVVALASVRVAYAAPGTELAAGDRTAHVLEPAPGLLFG